MAELIKDYLWAKCSTSEDKISIADIFLFDLFGLGHWRQNQRQPLVLVHSGGHQKKDDEQKVDIGHRGRGNGAAHLGFAIEFH